MLVPFRQRKRVCMNLNCRGERKANKKMSLIFLILVLVFVMELPDLKSIDTMYKIVRYVLQNYFVAICHFLVSTLSTVLGLLGHGEHCFCVIKRSSTYTRRVRYDDACHIDDQGVCQSDTCGFWIWARRFAIRGSIKTYIHVLKRLAPVRRPPRVIPYPPPQTRGVGPGTPPEEPVSPPPPPQTRGLGPGGGGIGGGGQFHTP